VVVVEVVGVLTIHDKRGSGVGVSRDSAATNRIVVVVATTTNLHFQGRFSTTDSSNNDAGATKREENDRKPESV
jgi:hypothetical protein